MTLTDSRPAVGVVKTIGRLVFLLVGTGIALVVSESVLRLVSPELEYAVHVPGTRRICRPEPGVMPGVYGENRFTINSLGIRGDDLTHRHRYRILTLGASAVACDFLDDSETWPYLLQDKLNVAQGDLTVWVGNIGASGRSTRDHILHMQHLLPRLPRIDAILFMGGAADFLLRLKRDTDYRPLWVEPPEYMDGLVRHAFALFPQPNPTAPFFKRTLIWRKVARLFDRLTRRVDPTTVHDEWGLNYNAWRQHRQAVGRRRQLPDLSIGIDEYRRNLNTIIDSAMARHLRVILVTQPAMWRPDLPEELDALLWMGGAAGFPNGKEYYLAEHLAEGLAIYNAVLLSICQTRGIDCVDLASMVPGDTTVFYDDMHFNESGAEQVAEILSRELLRRDPFVHRARS